MNQSFRTALKEGDEPAWVSRQKKVFTSWINLRIKGRDIAPVEDIFEDLKSGFVLYHLFEVLSGTSLRPLGKMNKNAKLRVQRVDNMNIVWAYIKQIDLPLVAIGPVDIVDGIPKLTLGLVWTLITFFIARELESALPASSTADDGAEKAKIASLNEIKSALCDWTNSHVQYYDDVDNVKRIPDDFADGKVFLAVLDSVAPEKHPYSASGDAAADVRRAMQAFEDDFGVPMMIDPDDAEALADEHALIPYLAELMKSLPPREERKVVVKLADEADGWLSANGEATIKQALAATGAAAPSVVAAAGADEEPAPETPEQAAERVARLMQDAGLRNVKVLPAPPVSAGSDDDGSDGAPDLPWGAIVVGERAGSPPDEGSDTTTPTVLLHASYGGGAAAVPEHAIWDGTSGFPAAWDLEAHAASPDPTAAASTDVGIGAAVAIAAIKSLLASLPDDAAAPPVSMKLVVSAAPPAGAKPVDSAARLKAFAVSEAARLEDGPPGVAGRAPDYVLCVEPNGGGTLNGSSSPECATALFACRGYCSGSVAMRVISEDASAPLVGASVGPIADPVLVLMKALGSLRHDAGGALAVPGLHAIKRSTFISALLPYDERALRADTGLLDECELVHAQGAEGGDASIPEQLQWYPGLAVTNIETTGGTETQEGTAGERLPKSATAVVELALCPGEAPGEALKSLEDLLRASAPWGAEVTFTPSGGATGYLSDPRTAFLDEMVNTLGNACRTADGRRSSRSLPGGPAALGSPAYRPAAAAFASVFPSAAVYGSACPVLDAAGATAQAKVCLFAYYSGHARFHLCSARRLSQRYWAARVLMRVNSCRGADSHRPTTSRQANRRVYTYPQI